MRAFINPLFLATAAVLAAGTVDSAHGSQGNQDVPYLKCTRHVMLRNKSYLGAVSMGGNGGSDAGMDKEANPRGEVRDLCGSMRLQAVQPFARKHVVLVAFFSCSLR